MHDKHCLLKESMIGEHTFSSQARHTGHEPKWILCDSFVVHLIDCYFCWMLKSVLIASRCGGLSQSISTPPLGKKAIVSRRIANTETVARLFRSHWLDSRHERIKRSGDLYWQRLGRAGRSKSACRFFELRSRDRTTARRASPCHFFITNATMKFHLALHQ